MCKKKHLFVVIKTIAVDLHTRMHWWNHELVQRTPRDRGWGSSGVGSVTGEELVSWNFDNTLLSLVKLQFVKENPVGFIYMVTPTI